MTSLRLKMAEDLRLRNLAVSTRDTYLRHVSAFARHFMVSPDKLGTAEVRAYLLHLEQLGRAPATRAVYHAALTFLYTQTLGRPEVMATVPRPRVPNNNDPVPLTHGEVRALLAAASERPFDYTFIVTMLATGLRITEACLLRVDDLDRRAGLVHVRKGKGGKARATMLSPKYLRLLERYWVVAHPRKPWLFPAQRLVCPGVVDRAHRWADHPVSKGTMATRLRGIVERASLRRTVTSHDMRRTFATWLLESGQDLRLIQVLLGHASPQTTARYTKVQPNLIARTPSPYDLL